MALFTDRAVVMIDGSRYLLRVGETSPEGVTLVSADSGGAVFEYRGRTLQRGLDGRTRAALAGASAAQEHHIYRDTRGMYRSVGSINGLTVKFLVDTGASAIAMNAAQARRLGVDVEVAFAESHAVVQIQHLFKAIHAPEGERFENNQFSVCQLGGQRGLQGQAPDLLRQLKAMIAW